MIEKLDLDILANVTAGTKIPYTVQSGDTLTKIATAFNTSVENLCKWNDIVDPNVINEGQHLVIKF